MYFTKMTVIAICSLSGFSYIWKRKGNFTWRFPRKVLDYQTWERRTRENRRTRRVLLKGSLQRVGGAESRHGTLTGMGLGDARWKIYSSRSRVLTLQGSDIEAYASVSEEFIQNGWLEFSDFGRFLFLYLEPAEAMENGSVYRFQGCMKKKGGTARYSPLMDFLQGIEEIDQGRFLIRALTVTKIERNWNLWRSEFTGYTERPSAL